MNLGQMIKKITKIANSNTPISSIICELLAQIGQNLSYDKKDQASVYDINIINDLSHDFWYYENHKTKKRLTPRNFFNKTVEIRQEKGESGVKDFYELHSEIYNKEEYLANINEATELLKQLQENGLTCKLIYDKKYKKCSLENRPEDIWIQIKL